MENKFFKDFYFKKELEIRIFRFIDLHILFVINLSSHVILEENISRFTLIHVKWLSEYELIDY